MSNWDEAMVNFIDTTDWAAATIAQLDAWTIWVGCETNFNRAAVAELQRRGYLFDCGSATWVKE